MSYTNNSSGGFNQNAQKRKIAVINHAIRAKTVLVIDSESNQKLGVMPTYEALRIANDKGLDLLQVDPGFNGNPPTCKILDYGKFKYDESKNEKAAKKKQREAQIEEKEMTFRPDTAVNDLRIKAKKVTEFLDAGARVRVSIRCHGREASHMNVVMETFNTFLSFIPNGAFEHVAPPNAEGRVKVISFKVFYKAE